MIIEVPEHVDKFEKYVKLLTEKFDVRIILDGVRAETNGNEIRLPNIMAMTEREVEFLYGILLHEIGHIKFSCFDKAMFAKMKSQFHFLLVNAIEDGRIENKMMGEYEGAKDIFATLYNDFSSDPAFMKKIFNAEAGKEQHPLFVLGLLLHHHILSIEVKDGVSDPKALKKANEWLEKIKHLLNTPLKSNEDSLNLATAIYDIIFANADDNSEKISVKEQEQEIDKNKKAIAEMLEQFKKIAEEADKIRKQVKATRKTKQGQTKELSKFQKTARPILTQADKTAQALEEAIESNKEYMDAKNAISALASALSDARKEMHKQAGKESRQTQNMEAGKATDTAGLSKEEKKKIDTKIKYNQKQAAKAKSNKETAEATVNSMKQQLEDMKKQLSEMSDKKFTKDGKSVNDLRNEGKQIDQSTQPLIEQEGKMSNEIDGLSQQIRQANRELREMQNNALEGSGQTIQSLDQMLKDAGMGEGLLPDFQEADDWNEADSAQQEFDKDASEALDTPVINGCSPFGSNVRDIIIRLTDVSDKLDTIDIAALLGKKFSVSKVESLNDFDSENTNTAEMGDGEATKAKPSTRPHLASTTKYDIVTQQVNGDAKELATIKKDKATDIEKLTNLLRAKFRFKQKPRFRHNQEEGSLDTREIWRVPNNLNADRIFEQQFKKPDSKVQVSVAIDISGSMDKAVSDYGDKVKALAVVLSQALENVHVKHEVVGYGAPICPDMMDEKASSAFNRRRNNLETIVFRSTGGQNGLTNIHLQAWDNSDGESVRVVASRLASAGAKKKIMFVFTDGKPFLTDGDVDVLDADLFRALDYCRKKGITVYGLGFNDAPKQFYGDNYCKVESVDKLIAFLQRKLEMVA
jgi:hypothetical protein